MKEIYEHFNIPLDLKIESLSERLFVFIEYLLIIENTQEDLKRLYETWILKLKDVASSDKNYVSRKELFTYLKKFPFISTLLLIRAPGNDILEDCEPNRQIAILAHVFNCRGNADYSAYLDFYKVFIERPKSTILSVSEILSSSSFELKKSFENAKESNVVDYGLIVQYLNHPFKRLDGDKKSAIANDYVLSEAIDEQDGFKITAVNVSSFDESESGSFLKLETEIPLTTTQQKNKFNKQKSGMQRAYYNAELCVFSSIRYALPDEVSLLFDVLCPHLKTGEYSKISIDTGKKLIVLFLSFFGLKNPLSIVLRNLSSKKDFLPFENEIYLEYSFVGNVKSTLCRLNLPANFLKTNLPAVSDERIHYQTVDRISFELPHPLTLMFHIVLHSIGPDKRRLHALNVAFDMTEQEYKKWLRTGLKNSGLSRKSITISAIHSAFLAFSRETVPESMMRYLSGQPAIQQHYVCFTAAEFSGHVLKIWRRFCSALRIHIKDQTADSNSISVSGDEIYNHVGSKITIRTDVYDAFFNDFSKKIGGLSPVGVLNNAALYIHMRIASTSGLRPVNEPYPNLAHTDLDHGIFTVADKRVHSEEERRLIVLAPSAASLLACWRRAAEAFSKKVSISPPSQALMFWQSGWISLKRAVINEQLELITNEQLSAYSMRHTAATGHIFLSSNFNQRKLDMLLNHSRAGVSVWSRFAIAAPAQLIAMQQQTIALYDSKYAEQDRMIFNALTRIL